MNLDLGHKKYFPIIGEQFMSEAIVIKFGGEIAETPTLLSNLSSSIKELVNQGEKIILVHGGGPAATKLSKTLGIEPKMVGGRRVTCEKTLDVMKMSLAGTINSDILAMLKKHKVIALSASGISFLNAKKRPPKAVSGSNGEIIDFGFVGDITSVDTFALESLINNNIVPVVNPLSCDENGQVLNINADTISVQIAKAIKAKKLVLITEVGGVFKDINDKSSRYSTLTHQEAKKLIADKIVEGGMIPKLEEGFTLFQGDLDVFHICGISKPEELLQEIKMPGSFGTAIFKN